MFSLYVYQFCSSPSYRGSYFKLGVRVRRFCGFVAGGLSHRELLEVSLTVSSGVCRGQGSQIQDRSSHRVSLEV